MPVVRGKSSHQVLSESQRDDLRTRLGREREGQTSTPGLVIFEIPVGGDMIDLLVVWDAWDGVRSEDRTGVILDVYQDWSAAIAQALGVTYEEAVEQNLLPYAVVPLTGQGEEDSARLREAMLREGGFPRPNGKVDLRFPTQTMAEEAFARLNAEYPRGSWTLAQGAAATMGLVISGSTP